MRAPREISRSRPMGMPQFWLFRDDNCPEHLNRSLAARTKLTGGAFHSACRLDGATLRMPARAHHVSPASDLLVADQPFHEARGEPGVDIERLELFARNVLRFGRMRGHDTQEFS